MLRVPRAHPSHTWPVSWVPFLYHVAFSLALQSETWFSGFILESIHWHSDDNLPLDLQPGVSQLVREADIKGYEEPKEVMCLHFC